MKIAVATLVVLGVLAAGAAAFFVRMLRLSPASIMPEAQTVNVVIAKADLPAMTVIAEDDIAAESVPRPSLPAGCLLSPVEAIGRSLNVAVMKGQVLTRSQLAAPGSPADSIARIPAGMRVVTIPVSSRSISGGFLHPGCTVDVMATYQQNGPSRDEPFSHLLLQRTTVWGVDDQTIASLQAQNDGEKAKSNSGPSSALYRVSLLVDMKQAEDLQSAASRGTITLAIRNPLDDTIAKPPEPVVDEHELPAAGAVAETPVVERQPLEPAPAPDKIVKVIRGGQVTDQAFPVNPGGERNGPADESNAVQSAELQTLDK